MWNEPTPEQLAKLPNLYETEKVPLKDKPIYIHFFIGDCDWFVSEYDGEDLFFGYAITGNPIFAEWGYMSFQELKQIRVPPGIEVDCTAKSRNKLDTQFRALKMLQDFFLAQDFCKGRRYFRRVVDTKLGRSIRDAN